MTGAVFNASLSDLLRDQDKTNYGDPERLRVINEAITEAHQEFLRTESYLARTKQTFTLTATQAYYDLPDGSTATPGFYQHVEGGAYISGEANPLVLMDARSRIDYQDADDGTPTGYWLSLNSTGSTRMNFNRAPLTNASMIMDYVSLPPIWSLSGQNASTDAGALNIITYSNAGLTTARSTPYGGMFDYALKYRVATLLLGRNNFKGREDFEPWGHEKFISAVSVTHKGNFSPMKTRPMHGHRRT